MTKKFLITLGFIFSIIVCGGIGYFWSDFRRHSFLAEYNITSSQIFLANAHQYGHQPAIKSTCLANQWWKKAAQQGSTYAKVTLGNLYIALAPEKVECVELSQPEIIDYILRATETGNYEGYYKLAERYTTDREQKIRYLEQGAFYNEPNALYALSGYYFASNHAYTLYLLEKSAKLGNPKAQTFLGDIYAGMTYTAKYLNIEQAINWYTKAAIQGEATAQKNLALLHLYAQGTPQNYDKAAFWLKKSAEQHDVESQLTLAMLIMYERGMSIGTYGTKNQSLELIHQLANDGYVEAQVELARLYLFGIGVLENHEKAAEWFQKAANQSDRLAQYQLGLLYVIGKGVPQNRRKARDLLYRARYTEYVDTSKPSGKAIIDEGYPFFRSY